MAARPLAVLAAIAIAFAQPAPASAQLFNMVVPDECVAMPTVHCLVEAAAALIDPEDLAQRLVEADEIDLALTYAAADDIDPEVLVWAEARRGNTAAVDALLARIDDADFAAQVLPVLGLALAQAGDIEAARDVFAATTALDTDFAARSIPLSAYLLGYAGDPEGARAIFAQLDIDDLDDDALPGALAAMTLLGNEDTARALFATEYADERPSTRARILTAIGVTEYFAGDLPGALETLTEAKALFADGVIDVAEQEAYAGLYKQSIATALMAVNPDGYNGPVVDHIERVLISAILTGQPDLAADLLHAQASWLIPAYYDTEPEALAVLSVVGADLTGVITIAATIDDLVERKVGSPGTELEFAL